MQEIHSIHLSKEAKKEIDQIGKDAKQQYNQWKRTLSGVLSDKQLSVGLTLLFFFYVFYASFNSITGEDQQVEDLQNCTCNETHRVFYQTLVITFGSIWLICFCLLTIWDLMRFFRVKPTSECFRWENIVNVFAKKVEERITEESMSERTAVSLSPKKQLQPAEVVSTEPLVASPPPLQVQRSSALKSATLKRLNHYENYLWLQFNRVYSVGAALSKHQQLKLPPIKNVVADEQKIRRMSMRKMSIQVNGRLVSTTTDDEPDEEKIFAHVMDEEDLVLRTAGVACSTVSFFLYPFLLTARLTAQVIIVPLMVIQLLDTHAWICINQDRYCDDLQSEYELGLDKTAISFGFYCSVLVAILASTMLRWFPCYKKAKQSGATSIA